MEGVDRHEGIRSGPRRRGGELHCLLLLAAACLSVAIAGTALAQGYGPPPEGMVIRLQGTTQVYVIQGGRKSFIPDYETFQSRGYQWEQVLEVDQRTLDSVATGLPIPSVRQRYQYSGPGQGPDGQGAVPRPAIPAQPPVSQDPGSGRVYPGGVGANRPSFGKLPMRVPTPMPGTTGQAVPGAGVAPAPQSAPMPVMPAQ